MFRIPVFYERSENIHTLIVFHIIMSHGARGIINKEHVRNTTLVSDMYTRKAHIETLHLNSCDREQFRNFVGI